MFCETAVSPGCKVTNLSPFRQRTVSCRRDTSATIQVAYLKNNEAHIRRVLDSIIRRMTPNAALRDDLLQEAMLHLWLKEDSRPGQTASWYSQSCRFHLQHYLNSGKSIDSARRWRDQFQIDHNVNDDEVLGEPADSGNSVLTFVCAREIISLLKRHLSLQEQEVLDCLSDGMGAREISRKLKLSHTMVIRHRRKIASLFTRLESPLQLELARHSNRKRITQLGSTGLAISSGGKSSELKPKEVSVVFQEQDMIRNVR